jgi:hypothetical protein
MEGHEMYFVNRGVCQVVLSENLGTTKGHKHIKLGMRTHILWRKVLAAAVWRRQYGGVGWCCCQLVLEVVLA